MNCPHCSKEVEAIPKARFDEVNAELKTAKAEAKDAKAEALIAARSAGDIEAVRKELESVKGAHARELAFRDVGVKSAEDRELVEWRYGKLPEEGRPAFDSWLTEGAKSDPVLTKAGIFGGATSAAQGATTPATATPPAKAPPPNTNANAQAPAPPQTISLEAIQRMRADGSWTQNRERVIQEVLGRPAAPLSKAQ